MAERAASLDLRLRRRVGRVGDPEDHDEDARLVAVLLEEQPLKHLRAGERLGRDQVRAVGQVADDRVGFGKGPAVVEDEDGNFAARG